MPSKLRRLGIVAPAAALLVAAACAGPSEPNEGTSSAPITTSPTPTATETPENSATPTDQVAEGHEIEVEVEDGQVKGPGSVQVAQGERIDLKVMSDAADEVHVHGYDIMKDVSPGSPARIGFSADVAGIFEVELEDAHLLLLRLEVTP